MRSSLLLLLLFVVDGIVMVVLIALVCGFVVFFVLCVTIVFGVGVLVRVIVLVCLE